MAPVIVEEAEAERDPETGSEAPEEECAAAAAPQGYDSECEEAAVAAVPRTRYQLREAAAPRRTTRSARRPSGSGARITQTDADLEYEVGMDRPSTSRMVQEAKLAVASTQPTAAIPPFLQKLCEILEQAPQDIVSWLPHGRSFIVKNVDRFCAEVLAKSFKSSNFASFVRQLNFYGFHKIAGETKKVWEFKHDKFRRDVPALLYEIRRKTAADYVAPEHSDVLELKGEVSTLRAQVAALTTQLSAVLGVLQTVAPGAVERAGLADIEVGVPENSDSAGGAGKPRPVKAKGGKASRAAAKVAKKASGGAGSRRARGRRASVSSSSSMSAVEKRRRTAAASDTDESGTEASSVSRARIASGAAEVPVISKAEPAVSRPTWGPKAAAGADGAVPYGGELPVDLVESFQANLGLGGDAAVEAVGPIDLTDWLEETDFDAAGAGSGGGMEVDSTAHTRTASSLSPPTLQRSVSGASVSQFFNQSQQPATDASEGPSNPTDLPTQAVLGATSTLLNQLPAAAFLTHLMAASAANGAAALSGGASVSAAQGTADPLA